MQKNKELQRIIPSRNNRKCNLRQGYAEEVRCVHKKLTTIFDTVIEILTKIVYNIRGVA
jgi:hypothetical protein